MDVEECNSFPPLVNNTLLYNFSLSPSYTCVPIEEAPIAGSTDKVDNSLKPSPPLVIPYSTNVLADSSLWDGGFVTTSLFGMNYKGNQSCHKLHSAISLPIL